MRDKKMYIYTLEDPITKEIRYIGKTKNIKDRYNRHLSKCYLEKYDKNTHKSRWIKKLLLSGNKPIIEILEICDEINVNEIEKYWIAQFKVWGFDLTNISDGGEIVGHWKGKKHTEESKEKMKINSRKQKIVEYDLSGNVIKIHECLTEASKNTDCHIYLISKCVKDKKYYTVDNRTFRYDGDEFDYITYNKNIQKYSKSVCKYDLEGKLINIYDSIRDASRSINGTETNKGNITKCCKKKLKNNGKYIIVKDYIWRFFEDTQGKSL